MFKKKKKNISRFDKHVIFPIKKKKKITFEHFYFGDAQLPKQYDASFQNQIVFAKLMGRGLFAYFDKMSHTVIITSLTIAGIGAPLVCRRHS